MISMQPMKDRVEVEIEGTLWYVVSSIKIGKQALTSFVRLPMFLWRTYLRTSVKRRLVIFLQLDVDLLVR